MEMTKDQELKLFMKVIEGYGVRASYGARQTMAIDAPFTDRFGLFGEVGHLYNQKEICAVWRNFVKGLQHFNLNDPVPILIVLVDHHL